MTCNIQFQGVASQWSDTTWYLTIFTTPDSFLFLYNDIFSKRTTQSQTPDLVYVPIRADKSRSCYWHWYKHLATKNAIFTYSSTARLTGYSTVVTWLMRNQQFMKVVPTPSLWWTTSRKEMFISMLASYFCSIWLPLFRS